MGFGAESLASFEEGWLETTELTGFKNLSDIKFRNSEDWPAVGV
jgi:hypothetical protein